MFTSACRGTLGDLIPSYSSADPNFMCRIRNSLSVSMSSIATRA